MSQEREGFYRYDTDDVVGMCPIDGGPLVNDPMLWPQVDLTDSLRQDLELGNIVLGFCPRRGHVAVISGSVLRSIIETGHEVAPTRALKYGESSALLAALRGLRD